MSLVSNFFRKFKKLQLGQQTPIIIGIVGSLLIAGTFVAQPSFPTPDKIFIFALCIGMIFSQGLQIVYRLGPFALLLFTYDSFRGIADQLNTRVNYMFMPDVDRYFFGSLPTETLQRWWWDGHVKWYDYLFYLPYMMHFLLPFVLAIIIWKKFESQYWRLITAYISVSFFAFIVFVLFPAAPPWMASDYGLIEPISRVSSHVWATLGISDFPSLYNEVAPNPVAAVPSLHAAYATLFALFVIAFFKFRLRYLAIIYPVLIYVGTVYQGEHYVIDELFGAVLGVAGFWASPWIARKLSKVVVTIKRMFLNVFIRLKTRF